MRRRSGLKLSRRQLYDLLRSMPLKRHAPLLGMSDAGLIKVLRRYYILAPRRGDWAKLTANKPITVRPFMPAPFGVEEDIYFPHATISEIPSELGRPPLTHPATNTISEHPMVVREHLSTYRIQVPKRSARHDRRITITHEYLRQQRRSPKGFVESGSGMLDMRVFRGSIGRAMRIQTALFRAVERREYEIIVRDDGTYVRVQGQDVRYQVAQDFETRNLRLVIVDQSQDVPKVFSDRSDITVEDQLNDFMAAIVTIALDRIAQFTTSAPLPVSFGDMPSANAVEVGAGPKQACGDHLYTCHDCGLEVLIAAGRT